jgi:glycosyltransferase involved in cell wall biosynthesis
MNSTVLSIITVSAFEEDRLRDTLDSISNLPCQIEHILVVPLTDLNSIKIWEGYKDKFKSKIFFDSKTGIYPAMNLGAQNALGKYILFLNAGDLISRNFSASKAIQLLTTSNHDAVVFQAEFDWRESINLSRQNFENFILQKRPGYVSHQSVVISKQAYLDYACFDFRFRIAADFKQLLLIWLHNNFDLTELIFTKVEFPKESATYNRRGRYETFVILMTTLPAKYKLKAGIQFIVNQIYT